MKKVAGAEIADFLRQLAGERGSAENTLTAYGRDLRRFAAFLDDDGVPGWGAVDASVIRRYLARMSRSASPSTVARHLAALRSFYRYLVRAQRVAANPLRNIRTPKQGRRLPRALTPDQTGTLLQAPDDSPRGLRDRAILEVLYASGARVSELAGIRVGELGDGRTLRVVGKGDKERVVHLTEAAQAALNEYLSRARPVLARTASPLPDDFVFVNDRGRRLSVRGLQFVVRQIARQASPG
ncbi:MAG: site-specific tyrosine recombinase XerD, partial [Armatimonadetes bacterium]|nr:site-specific tyrosine recombinase XerD [Armatimonadota bacterium]